MGYFVWQDIIALLGTIFGAAQSSRVPPGYPDNLYSTKFINGLHISVIVAICGILSNSSIPVTKNVDWVLQIVNFQIPLYGYVIVLTMGIYMPAITLLRLILIKIYQKRYKLSTVILFMAVIDISVLLHMMCLC